VRLEEITASSAAWLEATGQSVQCAVLEIEGWREYEMTPDEMNTWTIAIAIAISVLLGIAITTVSIRAGWTKIAAAAITYGILGLVFISAPKWTTLTLEYSGIKATLAQLKNENQRLHTEKMQLADANATFERQIGELSGLAKANTRTAANWLEKAGEVRNDIGWATFIPTKSDNLLVPVQSSDDAEIENILSTQGTGVGATKSLEAAGFTILKTASPADLQSVPATNLWIAPVQ
jgi:hypothetical protein